jgi:hypothetical protein
MCTFLNIHLIETRGSSWLRFVKFQCSRRITSRYKIFLYSSSFLCWLWLIRTTRGSAIHDNVHSCFSKYDACQHEVLTDCSELLKNISDAFGGATIP